MATELLFNLSNLFILPFWGLMILLPRWQWTEKVMKSLIPLAVLASVYLLLFIGSLNSESAAALASPELSAIAQAFADEKIMAVGWVHYLVMDLFVGRWIYWQGKETGIWTAHSLILCLFAGPIGLLSHLITAAITERLGKGNDSTTATPQAKVG
ncbi:MAG: ABA4-like family protein [Synechocystis sp.]|nr:ABA4-like family protein [Synechocystis sp.]